MINLLIAGYHGFGNCGDEAILRAIVNNINEMSDDVNITALSYKPEFTETEYGIKAVQRFNAFEVLSAIKKNDILVFGGGTLLQDGTSTRSLIYYLSLIRLAKLFRKRVMLYANGIGPVKEGFNRTIVKKVVDTVDLITLRESLSKEDLDKIGVTRPETFVTSDPAFTLKKSEDIDDIFNQEGIPTDKPIVGVSIRAWHKARYGEDYVKALAEACDLLAKEGKNIVLIPMEFPRDIEISKKLSQAMKEKSYIFTNRYNPCQILGIVGKCSLLISMRLHTLIFAAIENVPMLGVIYDPKVEYYLKVLEMPTAGDVRSERLSSSKIYSEAGKILSSLDTAKPALKKKSDELIKMAKKNDELLKQQFDIIRTQKEEK